MAPARVLILRDERDRKGPNEVDDAYRAEGLNVVIHPLNSELPSMAGESLIHISARIGETTTPREAHLIGAGANVIVRASSLIQAFLPNGEQQLRPFVILDVTDDGFDRARTLLLRNVFASGLFGEGARGVLAIGPYSRYDLSRVYKLLTSLLHGEGFGLADLHNAFWEQMQHTCPPALFTLDPDLPVWD